MRLTRRLKAGRKQLLIAVSLAIVTGGALAGGTMASAASSSAAGTATTTTTTIAKHPWPAKVSKLFLYVDNVSAAKQGIYGDCNQGSQFERGQQVLFRVAGTEVPSGAALTPQNTRIMSVYVPGVGLIPLVWNTHSFGVNAGQQAPAYWTALWVVPKTYPLGIVNFYVKVVTTSKVALDWHQIPIGASDLTINPT